MKKKQAMGEEKSKMGNFELNYFSNDPLQMSIVC